MNVVKKVDLPFDLFRRGKVRDVYEIDGRLLIVSTDRISAFDYILPSLIPGKGKVLNKISAYWFKFTENIVPNHLICDEPENLDEFAQFREVLEKRAVLTKKLQPLPCEAIVRGYIVGSGWKSYQRTGELCGIHLEDGLRFAQKFPQPLFTPSTKADVGGHDENISFVELVDLLGKDDAFTVRDLSITLYNYVSEFAAKKGIILADTKFEFGKDEIGNIVLMDEIFTPDSSRFWKKDEYETAIVNGTEPPAFDKQFVRNFLLNSDWDRNSTPPELPADVVAQTVEKYKEIYRILTGESI